MRRIVLGAVGSILILAGIVMAVMFRDDVKVFCLVTVLMSVTVLITGTMAHRWWRHWLAPRPFIHAVLVFLWLNGFVLPLSSIQARQDGPTPMSPGVRFALGELCALICSAIMAWVVRSMHSCETVVPPVPVQGDSGAGNVTDEKGGSGSVKE